MSDESDSEADGDATEHSADERTPLIRNNTGASTSQINFSEIHRDTLRRITNWEVFRSIQNRRVDRSTQVNPANRNSSSLLTSVEADINYITPITAPEHSLNGDFEPDRSEEGNPSRPQETRQQPGSSSANSRSSRPDVIV